MYIKQIILRVITEMDLNECAEIKKKISNETTTDRYGQYRLFFSPFIYLTRCAKMCQSVKDSHKFQGNKQKKNHESHLKHHCLVLIGITNKECV